MDQTPTPPPTTPETSPAPAQPVTPPSSAPTSPQTTTTNQTIMAGQSSKGMLIVTVVALVIILGLVVGGAYWYMTYGQSASQPTENTETTMTPAPTPAGDPLEKELEAVKEASPGSDFKKVDTDLNSL